MCIVDEEAYRAFSDIFDKYPTALDDYVNTLLYDNDNCYEQIDEFILYTHRNIDRLFDEWLDRFDIGDYGDYIYKYFGFSGIGDDLIDYDDDNKPSLNERGQDLLNERRK